MAVGRRSVRIFLVAFTGPVLDVPQVRLHPDRLDSSTPLVLGQAADLGSANGDGRVSRQGSHAGALGVS